MRCVRRSYLYHDGLEHQKSTPPADRVLKKGMSVGG